MEKLKKVVKRELLVVSISQLLEHVMKLVIVYELFLLGMKGWELGFSKFSEFYLINGTESGLQKIVEGFQLLVLASLNLVGITVVVVVVLRFLTKLNGTKSSIYPLIKKVSITFLSLVKRIGVLGFLIEFVLLDTELSKETVLNLESLVISVCIVLLLSRINAVTGNLFVERIFKHAKVQHATLNAFMIGQPDSSQYFEIREEWLPYFRDQQITTTTEKSFKGPVELSVHSECVSRFKGLPGKFHFSLDLCSVESFSLDLFLEKEGPK